MTEQNSLASPGPENETSRVKMHEGQVEISADDVRAMLLTQRPDLSDPLIRPVVSSGTVATLFRLDEDLVARYPLVPAADDVRRVEICGEIAHAQAVSTRVSLEVPEPVCVGEPNDRYPGWWSVWRWLPGETMCQDAVNDLNRFARDLASFVREYRAMPTDGRTWDGACRGGGPLLDKDEWVRHSIARSSHLVDTDTVTAIWEECLRADPHDDDPVFIHSDLLAANLLAREGRLAAVIDLGLPHAGDPAADLTPAWHILGSESRRIWREELTPDDESWTRAKGWALEQAIGALHYYEHSNQGMFSAARRTLNELIKEPSLR
ncbi:aminoglycoside phosphotransferase family protein [Pengzhenrongella sp.]|uniref:aminoglycoside phosphotransferase family protein n=1 Tax=Pengzhenrongella sp. TaxID=2888820 RepID=UPI002F9310F4